MILTLASKHTVLRKQGSKHVGRCPKCGGSESTTRFVVDAAKDFCHCFSCGFNADPVRFLRQVEGMTCPQAHRELGLACENPECPAWEKCSRGRSDGSSARKTDATAAQMIPAPPNRQADQPSDVWRVKANALVEYAHEQLLAAPEQLAYLAGRGLPLGAVQKYRLGYLPKDLYRERAAWGLPMELNSKGEPKKLWLPQGIVIPWLDQHGVHRIRIRKTTLGDSGARYYWLPGSGNDTIHMSPAARAHVIVESDLDGLLLDWLAGDLVSTIPLGSCRVKPKASASAALATSLRILVALDFDTPKWSEQNQKMIAPGAESCEWWAKTYPTTWKRWPVPAGKDPGEAYQAGVDLRAWILSGLPPALQIDLPAVEREEKAELPPAAAVKIVVMEIQGQEVYIVDDQPAWERMRHEGKMVFSSNELDRAAKFVSAADEDHRPQALELLLAAKREFGGYIQKTELFPE